MDTEGSRWVEATLEGTATSPAWEVTMTTVRFNFIPLFNVDFAHFSGSHMCIPVPQQIVRAE